MPHPGLQAEEILEPYSGDYLARTAVGSSAGVCAMSSARGKVDRGAGDESPAAHLGLQTE